MLTTRYRGTVTADNLATILGSVCSSEELISRADIAVSTGISRATSYRAVDDLLGGRLLDAVQPIGTAGRGRPPALLAPTASVVALGLQVDTSFAVARVLDLRGRVVVEHEDSRSFTGVTAQAALARVRRLARKALDAVPVGTTVCGAALAVPGVVDRDSGRVLVSPNLGWSDVAPIRELARGKGLGLSVHVGNEADFAALAVAQAAPARPSGLSDFLYVSGGIGVGGAAVVRGEVLGGRRGWGGEFGHVCVDPAGPTCTCGSTGCLEQYTGLPALLSAAGLPATADAAALAAAASEDSAGARKAVNGAAHALGVALGSVINVLDVPTVVLGGTLAELAEHLIPELEDQLSRRVITARWSPPRVVAASHERALGATGAALSRLCEVIADPAAWLHSSRTHV